MLLNLFRSLDRKVEIDRNHYVTFLKTVDIKTLIVEMDNSEPISINIVKRQQRDSSYESEDIKSWFAYRVSDNLSDEGIKYELIGLLSDNNYSKHKKHVLRCLSSLCVNTRDCELFELIISIVRELDNEEIITSVFSRLGELKKPASLNVDFLKFLLKDGTYQNKVDSVRALRNSDHTDIEDLLIQEFVLGDKHIKEMICATLRTTGTEKCFGVLDAEYKRTRSNSLKWAIKNAKDDIARR